MPSMDLADDRSTVYRVFPHGGGGSDGEMRGETWLVPAPPEKARTLDVTVTGFGDDWSRYAPVPGLPRRRSRPALDEPIRVRIEL